MATSQEYPDLPFVRPRSWTGGRGGHAVQYIVVHHTAGSERPTSAEEGALYDQRRSDGTSTHFFCDQDSTVQCVYTWDMAHSAFYWGNHLGIQYELCGGMQTREQWLDAASDSTLWIAAKQMARDCAKYGLPVRKLTPSQLVSGERGLCGHGDVTLAYGRGDHTDPGPYFPWDVLLTRINRFLSPGQPEEDDEMKPALFHKVVDGNVTYGLQTDSRFVQTYEYPIAQRWAELYGSSREISVSGFDLLAAEYGSNPEVGVP